MEALLIMSDDKDKYFVKYLEEKFTTLGKQIDDNTKLTREVSAKQDYTNGQVQSHARRLKSLESSRGKRLNLNPNLLYLLAVGGVIALAIVASILGVNLRGLL